MAGLTDDGFTVKTLQEIVDAVGQRQRASSEIGANQDTSTASPLGQINGSIGSELAELWELAALVWKSNDRDAATGKSQEQLCLLTGTTKRGAQPSRLLMTLGVDGSTTVPAGSQVSVDGSPTIVFESVADAENLTPDPVSLTDVEFVCVQPGDGPTHVNPGTATVIVTSVAGWNTATNPGSAIVGRNADNAIQLRKRQQDQLGLQGGSTVAGIRADLLDADTHPEFATIEKVLVLENPRTTADANGIPPHAFETIIDDGASPSVDDTLIAQSIWDTKPAGIRPYGTTTATAIDAEGDDQDVGFSRAERIAIYIEATLSVDGNSFPSDGADQVKTAWADRGSGLTISEDVIALFIRAAAFNVEGVKDVPVFKIGLGPGPDSSNNIAISFRQRSRFAVENFVITSVTEAPA